MKNYYLGLLRFVTIIRTKKGEEQINSEMFQIVKLKIKKRPEMD